MATSSNSNTSKVDHQLPDSGFYSPGTASFDGNNDTFDFDSTSTTVTAHSKSASMDDQHPVVLQPLSYSAIAARRAKSASSPELTRSQNDLMCRRSISCPSAEASTQTENETNDEPAAPPPRPLFVRIGARLRDLGDEIELQNAERRRRHLQLQAQRRATWTKVGMLVIQLLGSLILPAVC